MTGDRDMADDNTADAGKTFTQAELDAVVRDRLKRERDKFADYDALKQAATEAGKDRTALEKLLDRFGDMEKKLADSARQNMRAEAAEKKGLTRAQAARLQGDTLDELLADADEMIASWKPKGDTGSDGAKGDAGKGDAQGDGKDGDAGKADAGKTSDAGKTGDAGKDGAKTGDGDGKDGRPATKGYPPAGRPTEKLTSGAVPGATGDKTPAQLAEEILSRPF